MESVWWIIHVVLSTWMELHIWGELQCWKNVWKCWVSEWLAQKLINHQNECQNQSLTMCNHSSYICWFCCSNRFQGSFPAINAKKKKNINQHSLSLNPRGQWRQSRHMTKPTYRLNLPRLLLFRNRRLNGCVFAVQKAVRKTPRVVGIEPSTLHHGILENNLKSQANHQTIVSDNLFFFQVGHWKNIPTKFTFFLPNFYRPIFTT